MNNDDGKTGHAFGVSPAERAELIRLAADGELNAEQQMRFDALVRADASVSGRVAFEQSLKASCCRVLSADRVEGLSAERTESLCARIKAASAAANGSEDTVADPTESAPMRIAGTDAEAKSASSEGATVSFLNSLVRPLMSLAAAIVLVGFASFFVLDAFGPSYRAFDKNRASAATSFVSKEHSKCAMTEAGKARLSARAITELKGPWPQLIGTSVSISDIEDLGYRFIGGGDCAVPGTGASVHMLFEGQEIIDGEPVVRSVSLFIQRDEGNESGLEEGKTYWLDDTIAVSDAIDAPDSMTLVWRVGELLYYLVNECPNDCSLMRDMLGAPSTDVHDMVVPATRITESATPTAKN